MLHARDVCQCARVRVCCVFCMCVCMSAVWNDSALCILDTLRRGLTATPRGRLVPAPHHSSQGLLAKPGDHPGLQQGGAQGDGTWLARSAGFGSGGVTPPQGRAEGPGEVGPWCFPGCERWGSGCPALAGVLSRQLPLSITVSCWFFQAQKLVADHQAPAAPWCGPQPVPRAHAGPVLRREGRRCGGCEAAAAEGGQDRHRAPCHGGRGQGLKGWGPGAQLGPPGSCLSLARAPARLSVILRRCCC